MADMSLRLTSSLLRTSVNLLVARNASGIAASERLWRSFLYVPGDQDKKIHKISNLCNTTQITSSIPDVVVLDCEDAVSAENKALARRTIAMAMQARSFQKYRDSLQRCVSLRINAPSTGLAADDLHIVLSACVETMKAHGDEWPGPDYISVPKTESIGDLQWVEAQVMKIFQKHSVSRIPQIALIGMIESPSSLMNMRGLCTAAIKTLKLPLVAMVFGSDDYCACLGVPHTKSHQEALFARQYMVTMCRAYGLAALDLVETNLTDMEMFRQNCDFGAGLGYDGKQLIHPRQIEPANEAFAPSQERIEWARAVVEAASAQAGSPLDISALTAGCFAFRGHMIDRSTVRQAEHVVALAKLMSGLC